MAAAAPDRYPARRVSPSATLCPVLLDVKSTVEVKA